MTCKFDGQEYSEGSLVCSNGRELRCSSGGWVETGYNCGGPSGNEYIRTSPDSKYAATVKIGESVAADYKGAIPGSGCVVLTSSSLGTVTFTNTCPKCQIVFLNWGDGLHENYRLDPHGHIDLPMRAASLSSASGDCS